MNKKEMLIEYAKEIAEHCAEHDECDEKMCILYEIWKSSMSIPYGILPTILGF